VITNYTTEPARPFDLSYDGAVGGDLSGGKNLVDGEVGSAMRDLLTLLGMDSRCWMGQTQVDPIIDLGSPSDWVCPIIDLGSPSENAYKSTRIGHEVVTSVLNS
jgi:hypothetical protein